MEDSRVITIRNHRTMARRYLGVATTLYGYNTLEVSYMPSRTVEPLLSRLGSLGGGADLEDGSIRPKPLSEARNHSTDIQTDYTIKPLVDSSYHILARGMVSCVGMWSWYADKTRSRHGARQTHQQRGSGGTQGARTRSVPETRIQSMEDAHWLLNRIIKSKLRLLDLPLLLLHIQTLATRD